MKRTNIFLIIALLLVFILVITPWVIIFSMDLSGNTKYWSEFGDYFGGLASPLVAALALIALIKTLGQQQAQIEMLKNQSHKADMLIVIQNLENDYVDALKNFKFSHAVGGSTYEETTFNVLNRHTFPDWENLIISPEEIDPTGKYPYNDARPLHAEVFGIACGNLNQLRIYVEQHDEIALNNALSKYYSRKYKLHFERYLSKKILKSGFAVES
ncbi:MAG: hypothetical protein NVV73_07070 [Cellvibrionaceae bacterium]|nr:hypothetical protein [Cellvibrionaceae bacterium]